MILNFIIKGNCPSKKNKYRQGKGHWYKPDDVVSFIDSAIIQIKEQLSEFKRKDLPLKGKIEVKMIFEIKGRDKDLDNLIVTINDMLQSAGIIENDKQIVKIRAIKEKEKEDKVFIIVEKIDDFLY